MCLVGLVVVLIVFCLLLLCFKKDLYFDGSEFDKDVELVFEGKILILYLLDVVFVKVCIVLGFVGIVKEGLYNVFDMVFVVLFVVMVVGIFVLIIVEYMLIFEYMGKLFVLFLEFF